jgi:hypothetical protein
VIDVAGIKDDFLGLVKTSFFIAALYLLLTRAAGAKAIIGATTTGWTGVLKALEGR